MKYSVFIGGSMIGLAHPNPVFAGMPSINLTDIATLRLQDISFFLLVFFASTCVIHRIWNFLAADFHWLPEIGYRKATAIVSLWGIIFVLVLTMISGARELMTPEAWEHKEGRLTHRIRESPGQLEDQQIAEQQMFKRLSGLNRLNERLRLYADANNGEFPANESASGFPNDTWDFPIGFGLRYELVPDRRNSDGNLPLVWEPNVYPRSRLMISCDGTLHKLNPTETRDTNAQRMPLRKSGEAK